MAGALPAWSADGRAVAFVDAGPGGTDLVVAESASGTERRFPLPARNGPLQRYSTSPPDAVRWLTGTQVGLRWDGIAARVSVATGAVIAIRPDDLSPAPGAPLDYPFPGCRVLEP
jgi:hypothetical protein